MSTESRPGHGHSPAAWTAVVIMLVALHHRHDRLLLRRADRRLARGRSRRSSGSSSAGSWPRAGYGVGGSKLRPRRRTSLRCSPTSYAGALADAGARRAARPSRRRRARRARTPRPPLDALAALAPAERVKIIAEVKRASPSRGALAEIPDPAALAASYETGGASAISVLTEERRFSGSLADLEAVRAACRRPGAAQGLHRRAVPGARGTRRRGRPRAAHRRRARPAAARELLRRSSSSSA